MDGFPAFPKPDDTPLTKLLRHATRPGPKSRFLLVVLCLAYVFAAGLPALKAEPARPADFNSIKAIYSSRSQPDNSINEVIHFIAIRNPSHLPLYSVGLSLWMRYTGRDLFTVRLLSLLIALLAIAFAYRLTRDTAGKAAALDAAWLLSFLAFFVFYAHQARMYSLLALVAIWVVWSYWRLLGAGESAWRGRWLALLASSFAILYTHYFGFFLLAAIGLYHLLLAPKTIRWLQVCLALGGASIGGALQAFASIYSNGLPVLLLAAVIALGLGFRRLSPGPRYILFLALAVIALLIVANEITALIIARRMRYTIAAGALLILALAIAFNLLPAWRWLRLPVAALWIAAHIIYLRSDELYLYTNQLDQKHDAVPHFQALLYEPAIQPRSSDMILTFHPDTPLNEKKQLDYYSNRAGSWRGLIHIWQDAAGNALGQSSDTRYADPTSMANWNFPIWLLHNPQETDLASMPVFADGFAQRFHSCGPLPSKATKPLSTCM